MSAQVEVNGRVFILRYAEVIKLNDNGVVYSVLNWISN